MSSLYPCLFCGQVGVHRVACPERHMASLPKNPWVVDTQQMAFTPNFSGLLPDWMVRQHVKIEPFVEGEKRVGKLSYGLDSYGYDPRLGNQLKLFSPINSFPVLNPKKHNPQSMVTAELQKDEATGDEHFLIPPNTYALADTVEYFEIPRNVLVVCVGKSTYARVGLIVNVTPLEPQWRGRVTLEMHNGASLPVQVFVNEGICKFLFFYTAAECERSYADKQGIYQDQEGLTHARVQK